MNIKMKLREMTFKKHQNTKTPNSKLQNSKTPKCQNAKTPKPQNSRTPKQHYYTETTITFQSSLQPLTQSAIDAQPDIRHRAALVVGKVNDGGPIEHVDAIPLPAMLEMSSWIKREAIRVRENCGERDDGASILVDGIDSSLVGG